MRASVIAMWAKGCTLAAAFVYVSHVTIAHTAKVKDLQIAQLQSVIEILRVESVGKVTPMACDASPVHPAVIMFPPVAQPLKCPKVAKEAPVIVTKTITKEVSVGVCAAIAEFFK